MPARISVTFSHFLAVSWLVRVRLHRHIVMGCGGVPPFWSPLKGWPIFSRVFRVSSNTVNLKSFWASWETFLTLRLMSRYSVWECV